MSITLDNASNNTSAIGKLKSKYEPTMDGRFYHSRCVAYIINLVVQDGLSVHAINAIKESFKTMLKDVFKSDGRNHHPILKSVQKRGNLVYHLIRTFRQDGTPLIDHLDAQERKQDKSSLKNPVNFKEEILDAEVQQNEAIPLSEEEIALDVASIEGTMSGSGSGGEEQPRPQYDLLFVRYDIVFSVIWNVWNFSNGDVIMVEEDHDVIYENNSSDLALSANLNDLDFATLNIDDQLMKVEAPPPIIPVDNDDDFIDDEDDVPYDLADFDNKVAAAVARSHDGEVSVTRLSSVLDWIGSPKRKGGGRDGSGKGVRKATKNRELKKAVENHSLLEIGCDWIDQKTFIHVGKNVAWFSDFVGKLQHFDLESHMRGSRWDTSCKALMHISLSATNHIESIIKLRDMRANTPTGVPYAKEEMIAKVIDGK
nr:hypothetical protein [Tanacetum cinerariifolium]